MVAINVVGGCHCVVTPLRHQLSCSLVRQALHGVQGEVSLDYQGKNRLRTRELYQGCFLSTEECSNLLQSPPGRGEAKTESSALHGVPQASSGLANSRIGWSCRGKCGIIVVCLGGTRWSPRV